MNKLKISILFYFLYSILLIKPSFGQTFEKENPNSLFYKKHQQTNQQNIPLTSPHNYSSLKTILPEFRVSEKAGGSVQEFPCIARQGDTGYVMAWWDMRNRRAIWGQLLDNDFNKIGNNFMIADERVGHIITDRSKLRISANDSGEFVVIWNAGIPRYDSPDIVARKFNADGTPYSGTFLVTEDEGIVVNIYPDVVVNNDGSFVCVWNKTDVTFGPEAVWAKWYNADCTSKGDSILITDEGEQPALTGSGNGDITLLWASNYGYKGDAYVTRFDSSGTKVWDSIHVSQSAGGKMELDIEEDLSGNFALSWVRNQGGSNAQDIVLRILSAEGNPVTDEKVLNDVGGKAGYYSQGPSISTLNKEILTVWPDIRNDQYEIWGQIVDSLGNNIGVNFKVSDSARAKASAVSSIDNSGLVVWQDKGRSQEDIQLKTFSVSDDIYFSNSILVNDDIDDADQYSPRIMVNDNGQMVIVWTDYRSSTRDYYLQRFTGTGEFIGENHNATSGISISGGPTLSLTNYGKIHIGFSEFCAFSSPSYAKIIEFDDLGIESVKYIAGTCDEGASAAEFLPIDNERFTAVWSERNIYSAEFNYSGGGSNVVKINPDSLSGYNWINDVDQNSLGQTVILYQTEVDSLYCTYIQRYDTLGGTKYQPTLVNNQCSLLWQESNIAIDSEGNIFVAWADLNNDTSFTNVAFYKWENNEPYYESRISDQGDFSNWIEIDISVNTEGDIAVIWDSYDGNYWNVFGQRLNSSGKRFGDNFIVGSPPIGTHQLSPRLSFKDNLLYITWADDREAEIGGNLDIYATILDYNNVLSVSSNEANPIEEFELEQNYPNPFNPETVINYHLKKNSKVELDIFNSLGQKIYTLINQVQNKGTYKVIWNGKNNSQMSVSTGVYFYRLKTDDFINTKKMILIR